MRIFHHLSGAMYAAALACTVAAPAAAQSLSGGSLAGGSLAGGSLNGGSLAGSEGNLPSVTLPGSRSHDYNAATSCSSTGSVTTFVDNGTDPANATVAAGTVQCLQDGDEWYFDFPGNARATTSGWAAISQPVTACWVAHIDVFHPTTQFDIIFSGATSNRIQAFIGGNSYAANPQKYVVYTNSGLVTSTATITENQWHWACALYDASNSRVTVDGTETTGTTADATLDEMVIGASGSGAFGLDGGIERIIIWPDDVYDDAVTCGNSTGCLGKLAP